MSMQGASTNVSQNGENIYTSSALPLNLGRILPQPLGLVPCVTKVALSGAKGMTLISALEIGDGFRWISRIFSSSMVILIHENY